MALISKIDNQVNKQSFAENDNIANKFLLKVIANDYDRVD